MEAAKTDAEKAINVAEQSDSPGDLMLPYRDLAKILVEFKNYAEAANLFEQSMQIMDQDPPERHDRDAVRAEIRAHLGFAQYMAGDLVGGKNNLTAAIDTLQQQDRSYEVDVWLSGAYMRGAQMLQTQEPDTSKEYMTRAKEIIDTNEQLVDRKSDWGKLNQQLWPT